MIESSRRHGAFDPRYPRAQPPLLEAPANEAHRREPAFVSAALQAWEDEGGARAVAQASDRAGIA